MNGVCIDTTDEMNECPCGIVTNQAIVWNFPLDNYEWHQPICRQCQSDLKFSLDSLKGAKVDGRKQTAKPQR